MIDTLKNPLLHNGTAQKDRVAAALLPSFIQLDKREEGDFLNFAYELAETINYYNEANIHNEGDNWQCFFSASEAGMLAIIASIDVACWDLEYCELEVKFWENIANGKAPDYSPLLDKIYAIASKIQTLCEQLPNNSPLKKEIQAFIKNDIAQAIFNNKVENALARLIQYDKGNRQKADDNYKKIEDRYNKFLTKYDTNNNNRPISSACVQAWSLDDILCLVADDGFKENQNPDTCKENRLLRKLFQIFYQVLAKIVARAKVHLQVELANNPTHPAHITLFLAFVRLFSHLQTQLNGLTKRHLDFYFEQVLCLEKRDFIADQVYVLLELSQSFSEYKLDKGELFDAKRDEEGNRRAYALEEEFVANEAIVDAVYTEHLNLEAEKVNEEVTGYKYTNILGQAYPDWKKEAKKRIAKKDFVDWEMGKRRELGFVIAEPILKLSDGIRFIVISIDNISATNPDNTIDLANSISRIELSTKGNNSGVIRVNKVKENIDLTEATTAFNVIEKTIIIVLNENEPSVELPSQNKLNHQNNCIHPFIKLIFEENNTAKLLEYEVQNVSIWVLVQKHKKNIQIKTPYGIYENGTPFIFANPDANASNFYTEITSPELDSKNLIESENIPMVSFSISEKEEKPFHFSIDFRNIYNQEKVNQQQEYLSPVKSRFGIIYNENIEYNSSLLNDAQNILFSNFFRKNTLRSKNQTSNDPVVLAAGDATKPFFTAFISSFSIDKDLSTPIFIKEVSLTYVAVTQLKQNDSYNHDFQLYHQHPFGYNELNEAVNPLIPQYLPFENTFRSNGNLYIGINDFTPTQTLSLLFQMQNGTGDFNATPPNIEWSYLRRKASGIGFEWQKFRAENILMDSTKGNPSSEQSLLQTGIVRFNTPEDMTNEGTIIAPTEALYWIRASAIENVKEVANGNTIKLEKNIAALPNIIHIQAQAAVATFQNNNNDLAHLLTDLPAETIKKLVAQPRAVRKVEQPLPSFDGRPRETQLEFYGRISERLRHKDRAITLWDYERLLLEEYPEIRHVKCITHTMPGCEIAPGNVCLAVVPQINENSDFKILTPGFSRGKLEEMEGFLQAKASLFLQSPEKISVVNPDYEFIKVMACIKFFKGRSPAYYAAILNEDLKKYLAPWAFDAAADITFESEIYPSQILNFIEELDYVDKVTDFKLKHFRVDEDGELKRIIKLATEAEAGEPYLVAIPYSGKTSKTIFTSYIKTEGEEYDHELNIFGSDACKTCEDKHEFLDLKLCPDD